MTNEKLDESRRGADEDVKSFSGGDFDPREYYPLIDDVMAADDARDSLLASYQ